MAAKKTNSKKVVYTEPSNYVPKDVYDEFFKNEKKKPGTKKPATKKPTSKKK